VKPYNSGYYNGKNQKQQRVDKKLEKSGLNRRMKKEKKRKESTGTGGIQKKTTSRREFGERNRRNQGDIEKDFYPLRQHSHAFFEEVEADNFKRHEFDSRDLYHPRSFANSFEFNYRLSQWAREDIEGNPRLYHGASYNSNQFHQQIFFERGQPSRNRFLRSRNYQEQASRPNQELIQFDEKFEEEKGYQLRQFNTIMEVQHLSRIGNVRNNHAHTNIRLNFSLKKTE
jgi:hypothetical protein